jgi:hypothetical protein
MPTHAWAGHQLAAGDGVSSWGIASAIAGTLLSAIGMESERAAVDIASSAACSFCSW